MLAQGTSEARALHVFDTKGTAAGAAAAARAARQAGVRIVLGPLFEPEVRPVVAVAGRNLPVLSFSNDAALRESGAFVLGLTAAQLVSAVLRYAASRGIRSVAVGGATTGWGAQVRAAAIDAAKAIGIEINPVPENEAPTMPGAEDRLPDAMLLSDTVGLVRMAPALMASGIQPLAAFSGFDLSNDTLRALEGTWLAAPDPARFSAFARTFEDRVGSAPGVIAGLAYDAMTCVQQMRLSGGVDRSALLAAAGFKGVCGTVHFREDGSATRSLAMLQIRNARLQAITPPET